MPTYDYDCHSCGETIEVFQSMTSPQLENCPKCGGKIQRRMHAGAGLIFKGSGFYSTDYKKSSTNGSGKPAAKASESTDKSDSKKTADEGAKKTAESSSA